MNARTPSKTRQILFSVFSSVIGLALVLIGLEVFFQIYYLVRDGGYVSVEEKLAEERNTHQRSITKKGCRSIDAWLPHPYLGYVYNDTPPCGAEELNNINLHGRDFPFHKLPDKFVILITGGSVAEQFAGLFYRSPRYLERILNERYDFQGKQVMVLNGAVGGWKEPQQAILFLLFGDVVDAVITLDGLNEYWHIDGQLRFEFPDYRIANVPLLVKHGFDEMGWTWLNSKIFQFTETNWLFSHSKLAYFLSEQARNLISWKTVESQKANARNAYFNMFALPPGWDRERRRAFNISQYKKYIRLIYRSGLARNVKTAHFIQPVPQVGKDLTEEEREMLKRWLKKTRGIQVDPIRYRAIADELVSMSAEGVPIFSLLDVFRDYKGTIYADPYHCRRDRVTDYSPGYEIMAERIAEHLERAWNLKRK